MAREPTAEGLNECVPTALLTMARGELVAMNFRTETGFQSCRTGYSKYDWQPNPLKGVPNIVKS